MFEPRTILEHARHGCCGILLVAVGACRFESATLQPARIPPSTSAAEQSMMQATQPSATEIVLTRNFAAPIELVFATLTRPEHLPQWLGTREHTLVSCSFELQVGGKLRYVFQRPNGRQIEVRGILQALEVPRRFSYLESYDFSPLEVRVTTTLSASADGTALEQRLVYATREERDADFPGVASSSREAYARLAQYLQQLAP